MRGILPGACAPRSASARSIESATPIAPTPHRQAALIGAVRIPAGRVLRPSSALYYRHFHVASSRPARAARSLSAHRDDQSPGDAGDGGRGPRPLARSWARAHAAGPPRWPGNSGALRRAAGAGGRADLAPLWSLRRPAHRGRGAVAVAGREVRALRAPVLPRREARRAPRARRPPPGGGRGRGGRGGPQTRPTSLA